MPHGSSAEFRIDAPTLVAVTPPDVGASMALLPELLPALQPHVSLVVLRWPTAPAWAALRACRQLAALSLRPRLLVSDRFDMAELAGLDGVHLKDGGIPAARVRRLRPNWVVGVSLHEPMVWDRTQGADYAFVSPVFPTPSKPGAQPLGLVRLRELARQAPLPLLALGGVGAHNAAACRETGAAGVVASSGIFDQGDPVSAAVQIRAAL